MTYNAEKKREYYLANREEILRKSKEAYARNPEKYRQKKVKHRIDNPELYKERDAVNYIKHRDIIRDRQTKWAQGNPAIINSIQAKRRAVKLNATPKWADTEAIKSWYKLSKMFDETFKEKHHVDHIVPLQGKNICGLHVENNLQVLKAVDNLRKGNKV